MTEKMIDLIDGALTLYKDREFVTWREYSDMLLDLRLALTAPTITEEDKELWDSLTKISSAN